ncbi:MAG: hypothetical protein IJS07_08935 [Bacteroidales bacterium]|nr:hypothetical protein [Bacteroidales bacterium]
MINKLKLSILALLLLGAQMLCAMPSDRQSTYAFRHMRSDNSSLSFNSVSAITQDAKGFVWIGTSDGMNRFDGTGFKVYRKQELGLQSAFIVSLYADEKGNLWVGTDSGVSRYDYMSDRFIPLTEVSDMGTVIQNKVTCIRSDSDGTVWMSVNGQGLFSWDPATDQLRNYFYKDGATTLPAGITSFCIDNNGDFWFDLYCVGIFHSDSSLTAITAVEGSSVLRGDYIVDIARNQMSSSLLCASVERGLFELDTQSGELRTLIPGGEGAMPYKLLIDEDNFIWMPSTSGLWRYDVHTGEVCRFCHENEDDFSLGENRITAVFRDKSGGLWAGTGASGVDYCGFFQNHFRRYSSAQGSSLKGSLPRNMCPDSHGGVWIGTETIGLLYFDTESGSLSRYTKSASLPSELFGLCYDNGILWAGSYKGIIRLDLSSGRTRIYVKTGDVASFNDNKLYAIRKLSDGRILAGTPLGLLIYDRSSDKFTSTSGLDGVFITDILEDSRGRLWIASYANGVYLYDITRDQVTAHWSYGEEGANEIPSNKINSLMEDTSGRIWATSYSSGFFCLDGELPDGRVFNTRTNPSVLSDMTFVMLEDSRGCLWVSSNKGLMAFNPRTGEIDSYTADNGLLDNEFNISSGIRLPDSSLLFGSTNGLVGFHPRDLDVTVSSSEIVFTDFRVGGRLVGTGDEGSPLEVNINECDRIVLPSKSNSFGLRVTVPLLPCPYSGGISYRLEGYDGSSRHLSWTGRPRNLYWANVPPGRYVLKMSCGSSVHKDLTIIVRRHPLLSIVAICIYILLFMGIVAALAYYISYRAKRSSDLASYRDKMTFFTNVIHEIKTPLTLIKTPLQNIMAMRSGAESEIDEDLATISRSTDYMDKLVREMLDFVRIEEK